MKMRLMMFALLACSLGGCASVPLATGLAVGSLGVAGAALAVNAYHDCKADGGCKAVPLPK
jgi:hypothetical protein